MIQIVKFTECLESGLRVQNFGGKFSRGINIPTARLGQLIFETANQGSPTGTP